MVAAPAQSTRWSTRTFLTLRVIITRVSAMAPMGTFMRKIQRQPSMPKIVSTPAKKPPTTGPMTDDEANTASM